MAAGSPADARWMQTLIQAVKLLLKARSGSFGDRTWRIVTFHMLLMSLNYNDSFVQQLDRLLLCAACIAVVFVFQLLDRLANRFF